MFSKDKLLYEINRKGWSRYRLSKESGVAQTTLRDIFGEKQVTPSTKTLEKIASALEIPISLFFDDESIEEIKKERDYSLSIKEQENIDDEAKKIIEDLSISFSKDKDSLSEEDYFAVENAIRTTLEAIKIKNKKKFTPKKYR
ncbi:helix-turn-helix domain-containing protein [Clostridium beijerinckii]|uniref:helix-turn-helix domain-containing protein n=1 Tax=Clostridium beijerinckii TaxID=1520 RepID=UPI00098C6651|nr:helix-turn-helix transcriptional regulator [Clostridium beijerinckii]MBA8935841.1 transcriptional regulator with XRE-family HTH domain [Clostridium beijerinckii]MBA8935851.1 transcriptional regulator with XRE-family HTH domain [Clostridium beijerinckii]NRU35924.1 transcriptional regulator with XRE-family HTH domain [Clostridium beijerinckii]NRU41661.1 transcriptional regulator with XRE-family HTH domain [Clostridium beijerinckii]NSB00795.1 transcriptional regulator with XRE-family HTH domai